MAEVDTSFYSQFAPKPINPLEQMATIAGIRNTVFQNRLMQNQAAGQEMQNKLLGAQLGMGKNFSAAMTPQGMDVNKLVGMTAGDPETAPLAGQMAELGLQLNAPVEVSDEKGQRRFVPRQQLFNQSPEVSEAWNHINTAADKMKELVSNPNLTDKDIVRAAGDLVAAKTYSPQQVANAFSNPENPMPTGPDGSPASPEQLRQWLMPMAMQTAQARNQFQQMYGQPQVLAAPPPGVVESRVSGAKGTADASTSAFNQLQNEIGDSELTKFQIGQARDALKKTITGPGREGRVEAGKFLTALAPGGLESLIPGVDAEGDKYFDELKKYLSGLAVKNIADSGMAESEGKAILAAAANPSTALGNEAIADMLNIQDGVISYKRALDTAAKAANIPPEEFNKFRTDFNKQYDARAFMINDLSPAQKQEMQKSLKTKEDKARFVKSLRYAISNGLVPMPEGMNAAP